PVPIGDACKICEVGSKRVDGPIGAVRGGDDRMSLSHRHELPVHVANAIKIDSARSRNTLNPICAVRRTDYRIAVAHGDELSSAGGDTGQIKRAGIERALNPVRSPQRSYDSAGLSHSYIYVARICDAVKIIAGRCGALSPGRSVR